MGLFSKKVAAEPATEMDASPESSTPVSKANSLNNHPVVVEEGKVTFLAVMLGVISSIGGYMFGYESGQISGMSWKHAP